MKRTHRLRKKLLKKRFPFSDEWKPRRTGYQERLHSCPVCGKSRSAGYYECCANCFWVFEWQDKVRGLIAHASDMMKPRGAYLGVAFYTPEVATIGLTIRAFCDPEDSARYQMEGDRTTAQFEVNLRAREFRASTRISLLDLRNAREPKKIMLDEILELFEKSQKEMNNYIDRNGVMKTLGGCPVQVAGGCWGEPRRKNHVMFVRR